MVNKRAIVPIFPLRSLHQIYIGFWSHKKSPHKEGSLIKPEKKLFIWNTRVVVYRKATTCWGLLYIARDAYNVLLVLWVPGIVG